MPQSPLLDCEKYADLLVHYCLQLTPGETVLVRSTPLAEPLLQALQVAFAKCGAIPEFQLSFDHQLSLYLDHVTEENFDKMAPFYGLAASSFDAFLTIDAPYRLDGLSGVNSETLNRYHAALAKHKKIMMQRSVSGDCRWSLCVYPTQALADGAGMSLEHYAQFVEKGCFLHTPNPVDAWLKQRELQQRIVDELNQYSHFRYVGPEMDISFSTEGRTWINSDGRRNMPSGEVFTSPVEDSVEGHAYFGFPSRYKGTTVSGVRLEVEKGTVQKWTAEAGQDALDTAMKLENARIFGEAAIGTNSDIQTLTHNTLFDEKIGGSVHMALGSSYPEAGGKNSSPLHWDFITDFREGDIYGDGNLVYSKGRFTFI